MSLIPSIFGGRRSNVFDPFSLDVWDPFKDFHFPTSLSAENSAFVNTRVDWKETPEAHVFEADIPGLKKEEVKVQIEDDRVLQISGERNLEKEDKNDTWHRVERSSGNFMRRFRLPENAKVEQVKASMENGVLTVTVPKEEVKKPDVKAIEISATLMSSSSISQFDWHETTDSHVLKAEVPGLKKEEMKIEVDSERTLQVSGERNVEKKDESGVERSSCMFKKCFTLPPNAKLDLVKASYENGVLTITIPKMNEATAKAIENSGPRSNVFDPFSLDVWDPFKDFHFPTSVSAENSAFVSTRVDWKETPEAHVLKADIPGLKKEEVKVQIEDDRVLQISGERNLEKEDKNDTWHRVERSSGKFMRRFRLPENAKVEQVKASMENGVLTVTVPKEEIKKPDVKAIEISA
ncbi:class I heat shock protein [Glycine max]|nr:class I heat shock protein [Glycine max]